MATNMLNGDHARGCTVAVVAVDSRASSWGVHAIGVRIRGLAPTCAYQACAHNVTAAACGVDPCNPTHVGGQHDCLQAASLTSDGSALETPEVGACARASDV